MNAKQHTNARANRGVGTAPSLSVPQAAGASVGTPPPVLVPALFNFPHVRGFYAVSEA